MRGAAVGRDVLVFGLPPERSAAVPGGGPHPERVCALDRRTGIARWQQDLPGAVYTNAPPACWILGDVCVLAADGRCVWALDLDNGDILWTATPFDWMYSLAVSDDGVLYLAHQGTVIAYSGCSPSDSGIVTGKVTRAAGPPAVGVPLSLKSGAGPPITSATDESGTFRVRYLPPGRYEIRAGDGDFTASTSCEVKAGQVVRAKLALPPAKTGTISGSIEKREMRGPRYAAARDPGLTLIQAVQGAKVIAGVYVDDQGRYQLKNLPPGRYQVRALCGEAIPQTKSNVEVTAGVNRSHVDFLLTINLEAVSISGQVIAAQTRAPLRAAKVYIISGGRLVNFAATDTAGQYRVCNLPTGTYSLKVEMEGYLAETKEGILVPEHGQVQDVNFVVTAK